MLVAGVNSSFSSSVSQLYLETDMVLRLITLTTLHIKQCGHMWYVVKGLVDSSFPLFSPSSVCSILSVVGFVFAMCVAMTVAAHGGALAGFGIALISKPILFEVRLNSSPPHTDVHVTLPYHVVIPQMFDETAARTHIELKYCNTSETVDNCVNHVYTIARFCFWIIGIIG